MDELPPGRKVRFQVADPVRGRGSSWAVETRKQTGDVYLFHREGSRWMKASMHESGQWHYSLTPQGHAHISGATGPIGITHERPEIAPGWTRAAVITVATSELRTDYQEQVSSRGVMAVPTHADHNAVNIMVLLAMPDAPPVHIESAFLIGNMLRGDGGRAVVIAHPYTLPTGIHEFLAEPIAQAESDLQQLGWDGKPTRIVINGGSDEGYLHQFEVALG